MASRRIRCTRKLSTINLSCLRSHPWALVAVAMLACLAAPLRAQPSRFGGEVSLASQLVDRGLAVTPATPILQGSGSWTSPGGWSLGLAGGFEVRSPGRPVVALARVSRLWPLSGDWLAQANLLYYDYRGDGGRRIPDRADASIYFIYRDIVTIGISVIRVSGDRDSCLRGAADIDASWPVTQHLSVNAGAGIAQTDVAPYGADGYRHPDWRHDPIQLYGYGNVGLAWSDGPWHLQLDRNRNSIGARRAYGTQAPSTWVATLSRSF